MRIDRNKKIAGHDILKFVTPFASKVRSGSTISHVR
jgi:hypothetical protein